MYPMTGAVEKKVAESLFDAIRKRFSSRAELQKENAALKAQLDHEAAAIAAFEQKLAVLETRPEDDNIYWAKDGSGAAFCPLCICGPEKLFTPLSHGFSSGSYYCALHDQYFDTAELRKRRSKPRPRRRASRFSGPQGWMGR
jgi:hypothetical protein